MKVQIKADGGSRGNPGIAGSGTVLYDASGTVLTSIADYVGTATNNVAEYRALLNGLEAARDLGATEVEVLMDSKLVVEQMSGRWKIKHPDMKELALKAQAIARDFDAISYTWIPRAENSEADALANQAMDAGAAGAPIGIVAGGEDEAEEGTDGKTHTTCPTDPADPAAARTNRDVCGPTVFRAQQPSTDATGDAAGGRRGASISSAGWH